MNRKILFIGGNPKNSGGIETFGRNLAEVFKEQLEFYSYYKSEENLYDVKNVIEINKRIFFNRLINKLTFGKIDEYFINKIVEDKDIIILNNPNDLKKIHGKNIKKKILLVQHQSRESFFSRKDYLNKDINKLKKYEKNIAKIITLSSYDKEEFIGYFNLIKDKVTYIRHCSKIEKKEFLKEKNNKIITICRLSNQHKRIDLMLEVMELLPNYELEIWGEGQDKNYLIEKKERMKLNNVKFMGSTNEIVEKLDRSSFFIMTSDYEGYPIAAIEAIRRGVPLIIRNTFSAAKDIIGNNGILLEKEWDKYQFASAIEKVANNYEYYCKNTLKISDRYEYKIFEKKWKNLIEILIEEGKND